MGCVHISRVGGCGERGAEPFMDGCAPRMSGQLRGPIQNAQRAEVSAILHALQQLWTIACFLIDSAYVVNGMSLILRGVRPDGPEHRDFWSDVYRAA